MQNEAHKHFKIALIFSSVLAFMLIVFLLVYGKNHSFLMINQYHTSFFDYFFQYYTYLGDGIIWIPFFLYAVLFKKKYLILLVAGLVICTLLTQFLKHAVFPNDLRPIASLVKEIHHIPGVYINRANSFPSGHTSTAFTLALLLAFVTKRTTLDFLLPLMALFVGYSRVYLAQHFVTDVCAGLAVGIISAYLSLLFFQWYQKRKAAQLFPEAEEQMRGEM